MYMDYYGSKLDGKAREFYEDIHESLVRRKELVRTSYKMKEELFFQCIEAVQYDFPELFYVEFQKITYAEQEEYWEYKPKYLYSLRVSEEKKEAINKRIANIIGVLNNKGKTSVYDKCGWLHDYLVKNCTYNYDAKGRINEKRPAYTIEGVFLEGTAVCQGIALAYRFLCKLVGVDAIVARGRSLQPGSTTYGRHAWNIIRGREKAAHVDVTWDICMSGGDGSVHYDYFFLPDLEMMRDHQYVGYPICRQLKLSYFERNGNQFRELEELGKFIEKEFSKIKRNSSITDIYLYFKIKNRKETKENIEKFIISKVRKLTVGGFSYSIRYNETQSVFRYKIELENNI